MMLHNPLSISGLSGYAASVLAIRRRQEAATERMAPGQHFGAEQHAKRELVGARARSLAAEESLGAI